MELFILMLVKNTWQPIVTNAHFRKKIDQTIREIHEVISNKAPDPSIIGLFNGNCGSALFMFYFDRYFQTDVSSEKAIDFLENSMNALNEGYSYFPYATGITGILWSFILLNKEHFIESDCSFEEISEIIEKQMLGYAENNNFDYLHGAMGFCLYLLANNTIDHSAAITELLAILSKKGIVENDTIKWETIIQTNPTEIKGYGISLSHGIASVVILLTKILNRYPGHQLAQELLRKSTQFLVSQKNDPKKNCRSVYPSYVSTEKKVEESRLSWCYGDLGIALALYEAGIQLKNQVLVRDAVDTVLHASKRREPEENGIRDAGFCHGLIGVCHIFNRFYQKTGIVDFKETALYWLEKTMDSGQEGLTGYRKFSEKGWEDDNSLLEGLTGIGLSLISAVSDIEPVWDQSLLLS